MDEEALLAGIRAEPDDDLVRLAYADWLEERGRADEAELVRVQVGLAAMGERELARARLLRKPRVKRLNERAVSLGREYRRKAWPVLARLGCRDIEYCRGLLEKVSMPAEEFLEHGAEVVLRYPVLTLVLTDVVPHLQAVLESPALAGLRDLFLDDGALGRSVFANFTRASHLSGLRSLRLSRIRLNTRAVQTLASGPLSRLRSLDLRCCGVNTERAEALSRSPSLGRLEELRVRENPEADSWMPRLFQAASNLTGVRAFSLSQGGLCGDGVRRLAARFPASLRTLDLSWNPLRDEGAEAIADAAGMAGLRVLELRECGIRDRGAVALARAVSLTGVERLDLSENVIGDEGVIALARSPNFTRLVDLSLSGSELSEAAGRAFVESPYFPRELVLYLGHTRITPETFAALESRYRSVLGRPDMGGHW